MKSARQGVEEWVSKFAEKPTFQEEMAFMEGWNAAVTAVMDKLIEEMKGESK